MDKRQHIGDHFYHGCIADNAQVDHFFAHYFQEGPIAFEDLFITACKHGNFTGMGQMNAAGYGAFKHIESFFVGHPCQALDILEIGSAHFDPAASLGKIVKNAAFFFHHGPAGLGGGESCYDCLGSAAYDGNVIRAFGAGRGKGFTTFRAQIADSYVVPGFDQAHGQRVPQISQSNKSDFHVSSYTIFSFMFKGPMI